MVQKINVKDWRNLPVADWNTTTFREYLKAAHEQRYGIAYVTNNHGMEGRNLKTMIAEHGVEVVKRFIDECFAEYRPTRQWPGLSFNFMFAYQRGRILPRVLAEKKREGLAQTHEDNNEGLEDWL